MINKPYSESCDQNKEPILTVIKQWFTRPDSTVLEIGSGTGQHASFFPRFLDSVFWQPSDVESNIAAINAWRSEAGLDNVLPPKILNVNQPDWPISQVDYIFSANTVHIMSWSDVKKMFSGIRDVLQPGGIFCLYGPFNYNGTFTSPSNTQFDQWLKERDPLSGIRDFEALRDLGCSDKTGLNKLTIIKDHEMPANNRILVFQLEE